MSASPQAGAQLPRDTSVSFEVTLDYDLGEKSSADVDLRIFSPGNGSVVGFSETGVVSTLTAPHGRTTLNFARQFDARTAGQQLTVELSVVADGVTLGSQTLVYTIAA